MSTRTWLGVFFVLYLAVVGFGVFGPSPARPVAQAGRSARHLGAEVRAVISGGDAASAPKASRYVIGDLTAENVGNIVMFVPFGFVFPIRWRRWRWWTIAVGAALSASIELVQLVFLSWRSASLTDVEWNTMGAAVGFALWLGIHAIGQRLRD